MKYYRLGKEVMAFDIAEERGIDREVMIALTLDNTVSSYVVS